MLERRLLILVDGKRDHDQIWRITKIADYEHMLVQLEKRGYIAVGGSAGSSSTNTTAESPKRIVVQPEADHKSHGDSRGDSDDESARDFMLRTLKYMANPMLGARIATKVQDASDSELHIVMEDWYKAIADKPGNLMQVDGLKNQLLKKLT